MSRPRYEEVTCKSVLNRVRGMGFAWSINPYKGCVHGCHYCFARRYHQFLDLDAGSDFSGIIQVKVNAPEVLRRELASRSWRREPVTMGTATDPYQPIEGKYGITRGLLEALRDFRTPVTIITKGSMVVRDVEVLAALARCGGCTVCFSVTTLDEATWRRLEPGTPPPHQRLRAMRRLVDAGICAGVLLAPVLPRITDTLDNLQRITEAAAAHGARFLEAGVLRLQPGVKEHFLQFLAESYPNLSRTYAQTYPGAYASRDYQDRIHTLVRSLQDRHGIQELRLPAQPADQQPEAAQRPRQLALALS